MLSTGGFSCCRMLASGKGVPSNGSFSLLKSPLSPWPIPVSVESFQDAGIGISIHPVTPAHIFRRKYRQPPFEIFSLNTHETFFVRVPEASGLTVIQNKCVAVCPARWGQGQDLTVNLSAVHGSQVDQRSVSGCNRF